MLRAHLQELCRVPRDDLRAGGLPANLSKTSHLLRTKQILQPSAQCATVQLWPAA